MDSLEQCDDGNTLNNDGCSALCLTEVTGGIGCGNGIVNAGEQCDSGTENSDTLANTCRTNCTLPRCGDSAIDSGEQCDEGILNGNASGSCRATCRLPYCGDGVMDYRQGERCDDGNSVTGDGCSGSCQTETAIVAPVVIPPPSGSSSSSSLPGRPAPTETAPTRPPLYGSVLPSEMSDFVTSPEYDEWTTGGDPTHALITSKLNPARESEAMPEDTSGKTPVSAPATGPTMLFFLSLGFAGAFALMRKHKTNPLAFAFTTRPLYREKKS